VLSVLASRDGPSLRGRWLRLAWSQSLAGQPVRLIARLVRKDETEEHPLSAAMLGRGAWTWLMPRDLVRFELLVPEGAAEAIRIDVLETVSTARLAVALLRRRPAALVPLLWWRGRPRSRAVAVHEAMDLAEPEDFARYAAARSRPFEPTGLDQGLAVAAATGPRLGFAIRVNGREQLPDVGRTFAALAAQIDRGFSVRIMAPQELMGEIGGEGIGDRLIASPVIPGLAAGEGPESRNDREGEPVFVAPLLPGDEPCPEAVLLLRAHLAAHPELDVLYADSALRMPTGRGAQLKPDWSPLFQAGADYIGRPCLVRASLIEDGVAWRDLPGRIATTHGDGAIGHLKRVLVTLNAPVIPGRSEAEGKGIQGGSQTALDPLPGCSAAAGDDRGPRATLIVPTRDRADLLGRLVASLDRLPRGGHDLVIVDNGSAEPEALALLARLDATPGSTVLRRPGPFNFSTLVNAGVEAAAGPVVVLLNNDCEIVEGDAIGRLARLALRPGIGAVGAKLLYTDGWIQHAGVALGLGGEAGHRDRGRNADVPGSLGRLLVPHEVSAVTAACLAVRRDLFQEISGFDEALPVAFNDIDFCLRLAARGHRTILDPGAVLIHAESATRGRDDGERRARFLAEAGLFRERWRARILDDPFFHPALTTFRFRDLLG
jgi:GT2 family glycosyltransferase